MPPKKYVIRESIQSLRDCIVRSDSIPLKGHRVQPQVS